MNVSFSELTEALRTVDLEPQSYSGRGMYGRQCVSVKGSSQKDLISRIVMCGLEPEQVGQLIQMSHADSLGLGVVIYWPSIEWIKPQIEKYPSLHKAALHIAYDNGMVHRAMPESTWLYSLDAVLGSSDSSDLDTLEKWLSTLSPEDLETLCVGELEDMNRITTTCPTSGPDNQPLCRLLDDIFEH